MTTREIYDQAMFDYQFWCQMYDACILFKDHPKVTLWMIEHSRNQHQNAGGTADMMSIYLDAPNDTWEVNGPDDWSEIAPKE